MRETATTITAQQNAELVRTALEEHWRPLIKAAYGFIEGQVRAGNLIRPNNQQELALELAAETAATAIDDAKDYDPSRPAFAWLLGIARYKVLSYGRDEKRKYEREQDETRYSEVYAGDLRPVNVEEADWSEDDLFGRLAGADEEAANEARVDVEKFLPRMRPQDAEILRRYHLEDEALEEIVESLGISYDAAKVRLFRARNNMRKLLGS